MAPHFRTRLLSVLIVLVTCARGVSGESRTWTDKTGKFTIAAELVAVDGGNVVLRQADGTQLTIPIKQLSAADRELVEGKPERSDRRASNRPGAEFVEIAEDFFTELRGEKRDTAAGMLTKKGQELAQGDKSQLAGLPAPDEGKRAIRVGRAKVDGATADVPVQVRIAGKMHKTNLHFRQEEEQWRIFALSVERPGGEQSIDFESEAGEAGESDPLAALVGKPFAFAGITLDGKPLDPSRYQGKVVLFDFWATKSRPSLEEFPNLLANYRKYYQRGFEVVGVSTDDDLDKLAQFVKKANPPWAIVADVLAGERSSMAVKYGIRTVPALILVDKDGKVAAVNCHGKELGKQLDKMLGGAARGAAAAGGKAPGNQPSEIGSVEGEAQRRPRR
jgi:peroxiredoxin